MPSQSTSRNDKPVTSLTFQQEEQKLMRNRYRGPFRRMMTMMQMPVELLLLWLLLCLGHVRAAPCPLCRTDDSGVATTLTAYPFPDKELILPQLGLTSCLTLQTLSQTLLQDGTDTCFNTQRMGIYCGCPPPANACQLCGNRDGNTTNIMKDTAVPYNKAIVVPEYLGNAQEGFVDATCEVIVANTQNRIAGSAECQEAQTKYADTCQCGQETEDDDDDDDDNSESGGDDDKIKNPVCLDENQSSVAFPEKDMTEFILNSTNPVVAGIRTTLLGGGEGEDGQQLQMTCGMAEALASQATGDFLAFWNTDEHRLAAGECGCPPIENACEFCPTQDLQEPNKDFALNRVVFQFDMSCIQISRALSQFKATDEVCWASKNFAWTCGCNNYTPWYLGASTEEQHKVLAWIPRCSGSLSLLGSLFIIQDLMRKRFCTRGIHQFSTYQMILLGMSVFDISSSIAWIVSTAALPSYDEERENDSPVYGANGNDATCKAQGFFLELGFVGSTGFTASLTTFYLLSIVYGYREAKMKHIQGYFVVIPSVVALALASAAIPFYEPFYVACLVSNPNSDVGLDNERWIYVILFSILPVGIAILASVSNMGAILVFVIHRTHRANKWRLESQEFQPNQHRHKPSPAAHRAEKAVFWQAFWYVVAFLLTWMIFLIGQFKPYFSSEDEELYSFWVTMLVLNPLMGFWNAFVYVKPWSWHVVETVRSSIVGITGRMVPSSRMRHSTEDYRADDIISRNVPSSSAAYIAEDSKNAEGITAEKEASSPEKEASASLHDTAENELPQPPPDTQMKDEPEAEENEAFQQEFMDEEQQVVLEQEPSSVAKENN